MQRVVASSLELLEGAVDRAHDASLPRFVRDALAAYASCGEFANGLVRLACGRCKSERLVAFTCKTRIVCASCGARRMTDLAAHLVDEVLPFVPIRQWVLTVPFALRFAMAVRGDVVRAVRRALIAAIAARLQERRALARGRDALAEERGRCTRSESPRSGAVVVTQRFGSGLNLHVHFHVLVPDGLFSEGPGAPSFRDVGVFTSDDVGAVLVRTVEALVESGFFAGLFEDASPPDPDTLEPHDALRLASLQHRIALGPRRGERVERLGKRLERTLATRALELAPGRHKARYGGFDLEAGTRIAASDRRALERLCRYLVRPALGEDRLAFGDDGRITLALKSPWPDGTTHLRFTPLELVEKLAALVPRPHENLLVYYGVFAPRATHRSNYVAYGRSRAEDPEQTSACTRANGGTLSTRMRRDWATLMKRGLGLDVLACARCDGRMRIVAVVDRPSAARRIAEHLGLLRARDPPASPRDRRQKGDVDGRVVEYDEAPPPEDDPA